MERGVSVKRWMMALFAALAILWLLPADSQAMGFGITGDREGESLEIRADYDGTYGRVSACVFRVTFESDLIEFTGTGEIDGGYLVSSLDGNVLQTVYSSWTDGNGLESVSFEFKARNGADITATRVEVRVEQVAAAQGDVPELPPVSVELEGRPGLSNEAKLLVLRPDTGELVPEFSPDITQYEVSVPYSVTEMSFGAYASPGAKVSVNRKNLGSGGSDTLFRLTVTAEDGVAKQVYSVNVHRGEYIAPTPKPTATPKPANTPKPTGTPGPAKTPKPTETPKPAKTPKPAATPNAGGTPGPDGKPDAEGAADNGDAENSPLTEVVTIEKDGVGALDRLSALCGILAAVFGMSAVGIFIYERVNRRREEQLKGKRKK